MNPGSAAELNVGQKFDELLEITRPSIAIAVNLDHYRLDADYRLPRNKCGGYLPTM